MNVFEPVVAKLPVLFSKLLNLLFCVVFNVSTLAEVVSNELILAIFDADIVSNEPILLMFEEVIVSILFNLAEVEEVMISIALILAMFEAVIVSILLNLLFVEAVKVFVVPTLAVNACNVEIFVSLEPVYVFKSAVVANPKPLTTTEPVTCKL